MKLHRTVALASLVAAAIAAAGGNATTLSPKQCSMGKAAQHISYTKLSLNQKMTLARCNARHARGVLSYVKQYKHLYKQTTVNTAQSIVANHKKVLKRALANIKAINAALQAQYRAHFQYPWWWWRLGQCESGQSLTYNDGLYEGWINFLNSTWLDYGGGEFAPHAYQANMYEQYIVTMRMHAEVPWTQSNPECNRQIGLPE